MTAKSKVVALEHVVIRFSGDSGDGMQLTGNLFSDSTAFALTNARWALFRKATSMSSTLTPALVAVLAPALARTKQSWKTNRKK